MPRENDASQFQAKTIPHLRAWVWHCSDVSIALGQISILALFEVLIAMGVYWWLALHMDWPWFAMIGLVAAPVFLLRSDESVTMGVAMLQRWHARKEDLTRWERSALLLMTTLTIAFVSFVMASAWLSSHSGWEVFLQSTVLSAVAVAMAVAMAVAFTGVAVVADSFAFAFQPYLAYAMALGVTVRALYIRVSATSRNIPAGLKQLPHNWRETLMVIDLLHPPELLPKSESVSPIYSVSGLLKVMAEKKIADIGFAIPLMLLFWLSALAYRWSLKASAWLWWPLALALTPPYEGKAGQIQREHSAKISSGSWAYPVWLPAVVMVWLLLPVGPSLVPWLELAPEFFKPATSLLHLLQPPPVGLRYVLLWLVAILALSLWWHRTNHYAAWNKVLGTSDEYKKLDAEGLARFTVSAHRVERARLWLIVSIVLSGEALVLAFAHAKYPQDVSRWVWTWVLGWL